MIWLKLFSVFLAMPSFCLAYEPPYYSKLANRLVKAHIAEMKKDGFRACMTGGGMMYDVENISVGFDVQATPTIDEARVLFVRGVERLLHRVNEDSRIRPYLHNYPFTVANLTYTLSFPRVPVDQSRTGPIVYVVSINENVSYAFYDPAVKKGNPLTTAQDESYADALRIVREAGALDDLTQD